MAPQALLLTRGPTLTSFFMLFLFLFFFSSLFSSFLSTINTPRYVNFRCRIS